MSSFVSRWCWTCNLFHLENILSHTVPYFACMHHLWKQYSKALNAAYCKPSNLKNEGILADATTVASAEIYAIPTTLCLGFSSYSACAEKGITSKVPSGFTKSCAGGGEASFKRSGFFVAGGSSVATLNGLVGWRVAGVLMRGAWRAAALEAAQASATTRRGCIAAMGLLGRALAASSALVHVLAQQPG